MKYTFNIKIEVEADNNLDAYNLFLERMCCEEVSSTSEFETKKYLENINYDIFEIVSVSVE